MSKSLVSIIIPTYNSKSYLKDAVESALNQSYQPIEIIVVDDGSTDDTYKLFSEFKKEGVACYQIKNGGASSARNFGLNNASGDYIQFLDADDILAPSKIEKQLAVMKAHQADLSYTPWLYFKNDISKSKKQFKFTRINHTLQRSGKELMISFGMDNWFILTVSWLVKKELIQKAGYWNPARCPNDDGEYFSRVLFWAEQVVCCNEILAYYRKTQSDSLSKLNSFPKIEASFKSLKQIEALLQTCSDVSLLSYPKRLYYMQYRLVKKNYPHLAQRSARNFDNINAPSFLIKKGYYWNFINVFGLYKGTKFYKLVRPIWDLLKRNKSSK